MKRGVPRGRAATQSGAGLIEVMISVLILGIGLLGIAAMQATALKNSQSSLQRSQAVAQTYSILDSMRANRAAALNGDYNQSSMQCKAPAGGSLAQEDLLEWISAIKAGFGKPVDDETACGQVSCDNAGLCTVIVQWDDSRATAVAGGDGEQAAKHEGGTKRQVITAVQL